MIDGKTLYLVRHAQAGWMKDGQSDFERTLDAGGKTEAIEMGRRMKARKLSPDIVITSPAKRTIQTLELISSEAAISTERVVFNENIYEASLTDLRNVLQGLGDECDNVMMIGHNPGMTWLVKHLTKDEMGAMPTAGMATVHLKCEQWKDLGSCPATLKDFDFPGKSPTACEA